MERGKRERVKEPCSTATRHLCFGALDMVIFYQMIKLLSPEFVSLGTILPMCEPRPHHLLRILLSIGCVLVGCSGNPDPLESRVLGNAYFDAKKGSLDYEPTFEEILLEIPVAKRDEIRRRHTLRLVRFASDSPEFETNGTMRVVVTILDPETKRKYNILQDRSLNSPRLQ